MLLGTLPVKLYTGGVIAIEAKLAGHPEPLNFIFDSGSGGISLDSVTCEQLGIKLKQSDTTVNGIAGGKKVHFAFDQKLITDSITTEHLNFYINDYRLLSSSYGEKIDGIIGFGFLSRYVISVDFDSLILKIYSPGKFDYDKAGKTFRPSLRRLAAQSAVVYDHKKTAFNFYLDSGAGLCLLLSERFAKDSAVLSSKRKPVITQAEGLGGKAEMRLTVAKYVKLGPYKFRNVPVHLYNDTNDIFSYPYAGGLIGNDLLRRFNMVYNYGEGEVHLTPNRHYSDGFDYAYSGMSLYYADAKIYIDDIVPVSPAAKAGLKNGDELISVGGNITGNIQEYKNLLQKADADIKLIIRRSNITMLVTVRPASIR